MISINEIARYCRTCGEAVSNDLLGSPRIRLDDWLNEAIEKDQRDPAVNQSTAQTAVGSQLRIDFRFSASIEFAQGDKVMIRDEFRRFGCGMNKAKNGAALKHCEVNGLDFFIYRMGAEKIKRMIKYKYDITLDIESKSLDQITREAMDIEYQ